MKKADLKVGGIYARKHRGDVLLLSTDVVEYSWRERRHTLAALGTKPQRSVGYRGVSWGYLIATGLSAELAKLDAAKAFQAILDGRRAEALPDGVNLDMLYSLTPLLGEAGAVAEQERQERQLRRDADRKKTVEYNEAATALNRFLDTKLSLHFEGYTWSSYSPKIELTPEQAAEIAANADRMASERVAFTAEIAAQSFTEREMAGEIIVVPRDWGDDEDDED